MIEAYLQSRAGHYSPQTLNRIRSVLGHIFGGRNLSESASNAEPRRMVAEWNYLRWHEVKPVLEAISSEWKPLFAAAVYTGMRKRELLHLRKADIDWGNALMFVRSSRHGDTPGKAGAAIPIADELVPHLQLAVRRSPSDLVFPKRDGSMWAENVDLGGVLRRACARGIVEGCAQECREGCAFSERHADGAPGRCPTCSMSLSATACVRETRFHDLRNTTRSLLLSAGANPAAVHRILRDGHPRTATDVYGDFSSEYLRSEINRLRFDFASGAVAPSSRRAP
jgi:integrase